MLTGVPVVMGKQRNRQIANVEANVVKIGRGVYRLRRAHVLLLRIVVAYVLLALHCVYEAMVPHPKRSRRAPTALDCFLT